LLEFEKWYPDDFLLQVRWQSYEVIVEKRNHATKNGFNLETPEPEGMYNYLSSYFATKNDQETPTDP